MEYHFDLFKGELDKIFELYKDLYSDGRVPSRQKSIIRKMYKEWETRKVSKKTKLIYSSKFTEIHKKLQTL